MIKEGFFESDVEEVNSDKIIELALSQIASFYQGYQVPVEKQFEIKGPQMVRFLRIVDYTKNDEKPRYILDPGEKYFVNKNDLIMIRYGSKTAGRVVRGFDGVIANNIFKISFDKSFRVNKDFAFFALSRIDVFNQLNRFQSSSTMPAITFGMLDNLYMRIPDYSIQSAIANILSSLDDKIEINNKINQNLETLAQTLYKRWFVHFEFPNQNGEPYKSSGGEMIDSELGLIPKGWEVKEIQDIAETILGGTPSRSNKDYWGPGFQWLKSGELNNFRIIKGTEEITELGLKNSATKLMPNGTTLIAITGYVGLVSMLEIEACANQSVVGIIPNEEYPRSFLYPLIKNVIGTISLKQTGSAQQHINKNDINTHKVISPSTSKISSYAEFAESLNNKIAKNLFQNQKLAEIRDTLLPKLMNGEIEVPV